MWLETVAAIRLAVESRPHTDKPENKDLVFIARGGERWVQISDSEKRTWKDSTGKKFGKLLNRLDLKRMGLNFYAICHTFETIGGKSKDQVAVNGA